jgi:hypothetical protein
VLFSYTFSSKLRYYHITKKYYYQSVVAARSSGQRTGTRILRSCAAFHFVFAMRNIVTLLEFGKICGGIRQPTDTSTLPLFCQSQFGGEGNFVA